MLALEAQMQKMTVKGKLSFLLVSPPGGCWQKESVAFAGVGGRRSWDGDGSSGNPKEGPSATLPAPAPAPGLSSLSPSTPWYLGSWLQGWHKVFDHFGFRDCDSAHHKEDQERVVTGMRPAHLQNKPAPASDGPQCRALCSWAPSPLAPVSWGPRAATAQVKQTALGEIMISL